VPLAFVNEPIAISAGKNSDARYNAFYPRWAYDQYRARLAQAMSGAGAGYLDLWDIAPVAEFTNSPVHLNPAGSSRLAKRIAEALPGWLR
jgi:lysophospholipase L1-like esterase